MMDEIPITAWRKGLFEEPKELKPFMIPFKDLLHFLPAFYRMHKDIKKMKKRGEETVNVFQTRKSYSNKGLPIGGLGSGSIGRGYRGEFHFWNLRPGLPYESTVYADQFSAFVKYIEKGQKRTYSVVLSSLKPTTSQLCSWNWNLKGYNTYHALFPFAWTVYRDIVPNVNIVCKQFSPVIPHNYKESSYPVGIFEWTVENNRDTDIELALMFSFQNGMGKQNDFTGGHYNEYFNIEDKQLTGIELHYLDRQLKPLSLRDEKERFFVDPMSFVIATKTESEALISYLTRFNPLSDGKEVWNSFSKEGVLPNINDTTPSQPNEAIACALAVKVKIKAGEKKKVVFCLTWDKPIVRFARSEKSYYRRYTMFFGKDGKAARKIAIEAINNYSKWEQQIKKWHESLLSNKTLPDWLKTGLFNELYYLVEGGSVWIIDEDTKKEDDIGHFLYLESVDYLMFNTYDVHFYASFALISLWPKIELSIQRDFAKAVIEEDLEERILYATKDKKPRNIKGSVPHDLGSPLEDPLNKVNSYNLWNVAQWKDLNPKFVLQVYRDFYFTKDKKFLKEVWPAVKIALEYSLQFDKDNDGIIENNGFPDQTYDLWSVSGISAYTGGLWLAALTAAITMAEKMGEKEIKEHYEKLLEKGKEQYVKKLWNGKYLNYDTSESSYSHTIMADQLAGLLYCLLCDLSPYISLDKAKTALTTIFENNVMSFNNGKNGAVNGMLPEGKIDRSCMQSQEVWTGTTYALAALMLAVGLKEEAFITAKGVYRSTYYQYGFWFQTPEAWNEKGYYRALSYMRPLAIWALYHAKEVKVKENKK